MDHITSIISISTLLSASLLLVLHFLSNFHFCPYKVTTGTYLLRHRLVVWYNLFNSGRSNIFTCIIIYQRFNYLTNSSCFFGVNCKSSVPITCAVFILFYFFSRQVDAVIADCLWALSKKEMQYLLMSYLSNIIDMRKTCSEFDKQLLQLDVCFNISNFFPWQLHNSSIFLLISE